MTQILIVCTANICRSPVGEALLRDRLQKQGYAHWQVASAGTWASSGQLAAVYSAQLMSAQGLDITAHRSQPITEALLAESDLVLCMESGHVEALRVEFPHLAHKVNLISEMIGRRYSISDPYGGPLAEYQRMVTELGDLIDKGLPEIIRRAEANEATNRQ